MRPGLYALAMLDGGPLDPGDLRALGLDTPAGPGSVELRDRGCVLRAVAGSGDAGALAGVRTQDGFALMLGFLDEPAELAATLGLPADAFAVTLLLAAAARFGPDAPAHAAGDWTLLHWRSSAANLTCVTSESLRDPLCLAAAGRRLALAPSPLTLGALRWVQLRLDPEGFALAVARAGVRRLQAETTVWQGIARAEPATTHVCSARGVARTRSAELAPDPLWSGTFDEAVAALDRVGRRTLRRTLERNGRTAILLSGGLDSSLLAAWAALEAGPGREVVCLCSTAPAGSGLPDEWEFAAGVAGQLGLAVHPVLPAAELDPYRPDASLYDFAGAPTLDRWHPLTAGFFARARELGAAAVVNGALGEHTLTDKSPAPRRLPWPLSLPVPSALAGRAKHALAAAPGPRPRWPMDAFHVLLDPALAQSLPQPWRAAWRGGPPQPAPRGPADPTGVHPAMRKSASVPGATAWGLRSQMPFRDRRLVRLAASMPFGFHHRAAPGPGRHAGASGSPTRALARALLAGRIPETARLRTRGLPFWPEARARLEHQAAAARQRLDEIAPAAAGWLDVTALAASLTRVGQGSAGQAECDTAQLSMAAVEFLLWAEGARAKSISD